MKPLNIYDFVKKDRGDDADGAAAPCIVCGKDVTGRGYHTVQITYEGEVIPPEDSRSKEDDTYHHHAIGSGCVKRIRKLGFPKELLHLHH